MLTMLPSSSSPATSFAPFAITTFATITAVAPLAAPTTTATRPVTTAALATVMLGSLVFRRFSALGLWGRGRFGSCCRAGREPHQVGIFALLHQLDEIRIVRLAEEPLEAGSAHDR